MKMGLSISPCQTSMSAPLLGGVSMAQLLALLEGADGALYDPSDTTSLYQESTGETQVDTDGDVVGLVLDKAQMGDQTAAEFIAGQAALYEDDFSTDSGWLDPAIGTPTVTFPGDKVVIDGTSDFNATISQGYAFTVGQWYQIAVEANPTTGLYLVAVSELSDNKNNGSAFGDATGSTAETVTRLFKATATTMYVHLGTNTTGVAEFDNLSIKAIPGNHLVQGTTAAKPLYKKAINLGTGRPYLHWLDTDGVDDFTGFDFDGGAGPSDATILLAVRTSDTEAALLSGRTSGSLYGHFQDGEASTDIGAEDCYIDEVLVEDGTDSRDDLHTAVADGSWHIVEVRNADFSGASGIDIGRDVAGSKYLDGDFIGPILIDNDSLSAGDQTSARDLAYSILQEKAGVSLP